MIKKCPGCGLPVAGLDVCPLCGRDLIADAGLDDGENRFDVGTGEKLIKEFDRASSGKLSRMEILLLILSNLSVVLIVVNLIFSGLNWSCLTVQTLYFIYLATYVSMSGNLAKFVTRLGNSVFLFNIICAVCVFIHWLIADNVFLLFPDYIMPGMLIAAQLTVIFSLFSKSVTVVRALHAQLLFLVQSIVLFVLMLTEQTCADTAARILVAICFGIGVVTVLNLSFAYMFKFRKGIQEAFKFWE